MLHNWLKIAFINYKKNWLSTFINVFGLTLGLTGFMLILMHWNDEYSYESENPDKDRIFMIENDLGNEAGVWSSATYPQMRVSKEQIGDIEDYLLVNTWSGDAKIKYGSNLSTAKHFDATSNFFTFLPFQSISGDLKNALSDDSKIALSDITAKELFGDDYKNAVGKTVAIGDSKFVVSLIYKAPEFNTIFNAGSVILSPYLKDNYDQWGNFSWSGFFKLKEGTDVNKVKDRVDKIMYKNRIEIPAKEDGRTPEELLKSGASYKIFLTPLSKIKFDAKGWGIDKADKKTIYILLSLSVLILILSAINFINLKTAQSSQRAKEVGVRKAIGSNKAKLFFQFLLETTILCVTAYLFSLVLVELLLPSFNKFLNKELVMNDGNVFLYSFVILVLVIIFSGVIPAIYLSNFKPINTLKGNFARSSHGIWLRNGILALQLIISSFFIIAGLIIHAQISYMMEKDLGFTGDQAIVIPFNENKPNPYLKYELLKKELLKLRGIEDVTYSKQVFGGGDAGSSNVDYKEENKSIIATHGSIDLNYFDFYKIKLVSGRFLNPKLTTDTVSTAMVNEAFVKAMGWTPEKALDKEVKPGFAENKYKIIGVVKDFNLGAVASPIEPSLFFNYGRNWNKHQISNIQVKLKKDNIPQTIERIKGFWESKAEPGYPFEYEFIDKKFAKTYDKYKKQQTLFTILNAVVLIVALLGLFALSSLLIEQKLKDVAIKKTLGASEKSIVFDLTKRFLLIASIAVFISIPISYYFMNEWLKDFAYRIEMPWLPFVLSFVILLILTFAVVSIKAYRATQVNLVKYLKYE